MQESVEHGWDSAKRPQNIAKHGVDFEDIAFFEWEDAIVELDVREDYGEDRYVASGHIVGQRLYICVFTLREDALRIISLRKANQREEKEHEKQDALQPACLARGVGLFQGQRPWVANTHR